MGHGDRTIDPIPGQMPVPTTHGLESCLDYLMKILKERKLDSMPIHFFYFLSLQIEISQKFTIFAHGFRICAFSKLIDYVLAFAISSCPRNVE